MKQCYTYMITSFCITIMLMSCFTLYKAHEVIVDANSTFENFVEVYQASYYREKVIEEFNKNNYVFEVHEVADKKIIYMTYQICVLHTRLNKTIKAELLMKV